MTTIGAAKRLLTGLESYLAGIFHPLPEERVITGAIQSVYNWFFPFLRNAFICGVLQYLADASGSVMLQVMAIIAYAALAAYCLSYVNVWVLTPFHFVKHKRLAFFLDAVVTLAVLLSLWLSEPRIALASGVAFLVGQLLDIAVFQRLRTLSWWRAPLASSSAGSVGASRSPGQNIQRPRIPIAAGTNTIETARLISTTTAIAGPSARTKSIPASRSVARPAAMISPAVRMIGPTRALSR